MCPGNPPVERRVPRWQNELPVAVAQEEPKLPFVQRVDVRDLAQLRGRLVTGGR
jgi:hypothetical protein